MPRVETDRENLMRDASALRIRGELRVPGWNGTVIAGCRDNGGWSIYVGEDPCYHFDAEGRLRRAFVHGLLYRTQGGTLAELRRNRSPDASQLIRRDLENVERDAFLREMQRRLAQLRSALQTGAAALLQSVPDEADVPGLLASFLDGMLNSPLELAPPIKTRPC